MDLRPQRVTRAKEPYDPPKVSRVKLVPEEMAAVGCKSGNGPGRFARCHFGASRCSRLGS